MEEDSSSHAQAYRQHRVCCHFVCGTLLRRSEECLDKNVVCYDVHGSIDLQVFRVVRNNLLG